MNKFFVFFVFLAAFCLASPGLEARTESIAVVVNEDVITQSDVSDRLKLIASSAGLPATKEVRDKLLPQVVSGLVDEQLMLQEAERLGIDVTPEEIAEGFAVIARQNNMEPEAFRTMLRRGGIDLATMERQIKAQMAWSRVIQMEMRPKVNISDNDIEAELARFGGKAGEREYLLAEISLPVESPDQEENVKLLATRLHQQIGGVEEKFFQTAQQFSGAAGAAQGGDLGWVQESQMTKDMAAAVKALQKGQVSLPVRSLTGYHLYYLRDLRQGGTENAPSREQIINKLGVERLERMQRRHLMDLKAAAFIESRV